MTHSAKKLQNWQPLGKRQEETLRVANIFSCHCSLLDICLQPTNELSMSTLLRTLLLLCFCELLVNFSSPC